MMNRWMYSLALAALVALPSMSSIAQAAASQSADPSAGQQSSQRGVEIDRLAAVVNDDVILESDVDEERRLAAFQPFRDVRRTSTRDQIMERLIDRKLILQQAKIQAEGQVTDKDVDDQLAALRKEIPACKAYHCDTDTGWEKFIADQGFTSEELKKLWRERMEVLQFIEVRFRSGIQISQDEIAQYYQKTLLPQYSSEKVTAPKLDAISNRIQEVLLQQQVSSLLNDWLKTLRAQGTVRTVTQTGVAQ